VSLHTDPALTAGPSDRIRLTRNVWTAPGVRAGLLLLTGSSILGPLDDTCGELRAFWSPTWSSDGLTDVWVVCDGVPFEAPSLASMLTDVSYQLPVT
jgi:hypothetical protein